MSEVYTWARAITDEEYESLGLTVPERGESFEDWFRKNFGDEE